MHIFTYNTFFIFFDLMFAKKPAAELSTSNSTSASLLGDKEDNYRVYSMFIQFLKMVQDQNYEEAYELGLLSNRIVIQF